MQALSGMQRNRAYQNTLIPIWSLPLFLVYESLSSLYLLLPPLLGLLFVLMMEAYEREDTRSLFVIIAMLVIFEAEKGYLFLSTFLYFVLLYRLLIPLLKQYIVCESCLRMFYVILAYVGYTLLMMLLSQIFLFEIPVFGSYMIYYIIIEFLLIQLL